MGYSNSKWRKILIILSIINLCFVLFARFSKVFGAYETTINNTNVTFSDSFLDNSPYFAIFTYNNGGKGYVVRSDQPITFGQLNSANYPFRYDFSGTGDYDARHMVKYWNSASSSNFSSVVSYVSGTDFTSVDSGTFSKSLTFNIPNSTGNTLIPVFSNYDLYDINDTSNVIFQGTDTNPFYAPHFQNVSEIEGSTFTDIIISRGDYSYNDYLYFHLLEITYTNGETTPSTYYYSDKTFALNKDSKYYYTYAGDTDNQYSYYAISRSALSLNPNSSYLYVLTNSQEGFNNSSGVLEEDEENGIYDVITSDTSGVITATESINDKIQNIEDTINDKTVSSETNVDIENSLNFNNDNSFLNALNFGFFSRLTALINNVSDYNLSEVSEITIPLPFYVDIPNGGEVNKTLTIPSNIISSFMDSNHPAFGYSLKVIFNAFWYFIFTFYVWRFVNKLYIAIASGKILDNFSSSDEVITNNML